ncbi:MAG TPA: PAS domain S-box protein, partial [Acidobacteriota bacterium]|nr:PAS domain S-box protein [Acidobacteriota bacterium]
MKTKRVKVLLIEDDSNNASAIMEILAAESSPEFDVEWVKTLSQGLEKLDSGRIHLVLLDLSLPDSSGLDTLIKASAKAPQLPIVVLTGLADETLGIKAVQEGAQDYLIKGQFSVSTLLRSIRYALERKRFEEELRRQTNLYQTLLQAHSDLGEGFMVVENPRVARVNEAFCRISGYTEEELFAMASVFDLIVPDQRRMMTERLRKRLRSEKVPDHYEASILSKHGKEVKLEVAVKLLSAEAEQVIFLVRDITERKKEMLRAERHEAARKMLQVLMHEIYDPMTGIIGNLSLLENEEVLPQVRECLKDIAECTKKIQSALKQLKHLDLADPTPLAENRHSENGQGKVN